MIEVLGGGLVNWWVPCYACRHDTFFNMASQPESCRPSQFYPAFPASRKQNIELSASESLVDVGRPPGTRVGET